MASGSSVKHTFSSLIKQRSPKNRYRGTIVSMRELDAAFQGAGQKAGLEIWRIENMHPVPMPKSLHGKFFTGDSYLILKSTPLKDDAFLYDIHYWIGKETSPEEAATAAAKAIELDATIGGRTVQYREAQGNETDKFLSYFKPCIIPQQGGFASGYKNDINEREYSTRLYVCKGKHVVHVKEVPFARASLNHDDIFVLDTKSKIFQFNGMNSAIQERARALDVVQYLKDSNHEGKCEVAAVEDGRLMADPEAGEFWSIFGGFAPLPRKTLSETHGKTVALPNKLLRISKGQTATVISDNLARDILETNLCYLLDSGHELYVWMGRETSLDDRKQAVAYAEEMLRSPSRQKTHVVHTMEGSETVTFRSKFDSWPEKAETTVSEEGKGKVAALLKRQGLNVRGLPKPLQVKDEPQPYIDWTGHLEVWRVNDDEKTLLHDDHYKFYTGDCYIFRYYYPGEDGEECMIGTWFGKKSIEDERTSSLSMANKMMEVAKNQAVLGHFYEGKEPIQFFVIFQNVVIFKGGVSSGHKRYIQENGIDDESYSAQGVALFRVQGYGPENMQAIQVDLVASSLNSSHCYILQDGDMFYIWLGNLSTSVDKGLAERQVDVLKLDSQYKFVREGSETEKFWKLLGGKSEYPSQKIAVFQESDPHLFACTLINGKLKVKEIYNFTQDDLMTEDIFILDCLSCIYVWMGSMVDTKVQARALSIAKKFLELDCLAEKLSQQSPVYIVPERSEPKFFTRYFSWDSTKAAMIGNSYQRKLAIVTNGVKPVYKPKRRTALAYGGRSSGPESPQRSRSVTFSPDRPRARGRSPAFNALAANFENPNARNLSTPPPAVKRPPRSASPDPEKAPARSPAILALSSSFDRPKPNLIPKSIKASPEASKATAEPRNQKLESDGKAMSTAGSSLESQPIIEDAKEGEAEDDEGLPTYPYEHLRTNSTYPINDIDVTRRETYLSSAEFRSIFGMTKSAFSNLPKWKQNRLKISHQLF